MKKLFRRFPCCGSPARPRLHNFLLAVAEQRLFAGADRNSLDLEKAFMTSASHAVIEPDFAGMHAMECSSQEDRWRTASATTPRRAEAHGREQHRDRLPAAVKTTTRVGSVSKLTSSRTAKPSFIRHGAGRGEEYRGLSLARSLMHFRAILGPPRRW